MSVVGYVQDVAASALSYC